MPAMEIRGPSISLQLPHPAHAARLLELAGDPEVTRWFSWGPYRTIDEPLRWIDAQRERRESGAQIDFVVCDSDGRAIGVTGLTELSSRDRRAIVGTWFGRDFWGTGANRESKALIFHLAFAVCGMARVGAYANPENLRSVRALEKVGFRREGTLRHWHRHGDRQLDVHIFGLLAEEWRESELSRIEVEVVGRPPEPWLVGPPIRPAATPRRTLG